MTAANLYFFLAMVVDAVLSPKGINYEVQALIGVKASFKDPHGVLGNWDKDSVDPCSWSIVTCSPTKLGHPLVAVLALRKVPECNNSLLNDFIRLYHNVNINIAVQIEHALFVPVIKDADKKGLATIADEVKQLTQRARDNSLKPKDYKGGAFAVSNLGGPLKLSSSVPS